MCGTPRRQERFRSLIPSYIRNSSGTIVVYDITSRASFLGTFKWIDEVRAERGDSVVIFLVGNKLDAQEKRVVSTEEAQKKAEEYNLVFMEVSAKQGKNVKALFRKMAELSLCQTTTRVVLVRKEMVWVTVAASRLCWANSGTPFLLTPSRLPQSDRSGLQTNNNNNRGNDDTNGFANYTQGRCC
ncbi:small GTP-binding protein RAB6 [Trypanosoma cruzi]|nr:small GTP-binding protein RAB6 [Trypanosoma cruzi]